jgi:hypothetical protein
MTVASHSGFVMSRGREWSRANWMHNWRQSPGFGRAMWRTWYSRSVLVLDQYGWSSPNGTSTSRRRNTGDTCSRLR